MSQILQQPAADGTPASAPKRASNLRPVTFEEFAADLDAGDDTAAHVAFWLDTGRALQPPRGQGLAALAGLLRGGVNACVSVACFPRTQRIRRTKDAALRSRALVLDIDAGPGKALADRKAAVAAGVAFARAARLLPTHVVLSGGGAHLWFMLRESLPINEWARLAARLAHAADSHALPFDRQCTTDPARVLRAPETVNRKAERPDWTMAAYRVQGRDLYTAAELDALLPALDVPTEARAALDVNAALGFDGVAHFPRSPDNDARVRSALDALGEHYRKAGTYARADWLPITLALGSLDVAQGWAGRGAELALEHSRRAPGFTDDADVRKALASYDGKRSDRVGVGSLFHRAQAIGWVPPAPAAAQGEAGEPWVKEINQRHALVRIGGDVFVLDRQSPIDTPAGIAHTLGFMRPSAFRALLKGRTVMQAGRPVAVADAWLAHPARAQFDGCSLAPDVKLPPNILNLWQGYAVTPEPGDVGPWIELAEALIPDAPVREYVIRWLAWKLRNPGQVPGTVLLLTGVHGSGKNSLVEVVARIFGPHGRVLGTAQQAAGQFNGHLAMTLFCVMDEAHFAADPREHDRLKAMITSTVTTFESKGKDPVPGVNRCGFVMLTNHVHAWAASITERRAVVVETGDAKVGDFNFWRRFHAWADGPGPAALLHHLTTEIDLTDFNVRAIPKTDALRRQVEMTALKDVAAAWWAGVLSDGLLRIRDGGFARTITLADDTDTAIPQPDLRSSFEDSAGRHRPGDFDATMKKLRVWHTLQSRRRAGPGRVREIVFGPLPRLREEFQRTTGVQIDADSGEA